MGYSTVASIPVRGEDYPYWRQSLAITLVYMNHEQIGGNENRPLGEPNSSFPFVSPNSWGWKIHF